jgi:glycosyltransferase involved in cell wall biosynthesis
VCADFESCREVLSNPEVGIIVPRGDDVALAEAVLALLDDPERRRRLGEAARAHARAAFGWDRLVREMEALYSEIAGADLREGAAS